MERVSYGRFGAQYKAHRERLNHNGSGRRRKFNEITKDEIARLTNWVHRETNTHTLINKITAIFDRLPTYTASKFLTIMKNRRISLKSEQGDALTKCVVNRFTHDKTDSRHVSMAYLDLTSMGGKLEIANQLRDHFIKHIESSTGLGFGIVLKTIRRIGYTQLFPHFVEHFRKNFGTMTLDDRIFAAHQLKEIGVDVIETRMVTVFDILPSERNEDRNIEAALFTLDPDQIHKNKPACDQLLRVFESFLQRANKAAIIRIAKILLTLDFVPTSVYARLINRVLTAPAEKMQLSQDEFNTLLYFLQKTPKELEERMRALAHQGWLLMTLPKDKSLFCQNLFKSCHIHHVHLYNYLSDTLKETLDDRSLGILLDIAIGLNPDSIRPTRDEISREHQRLVDSDPEHLIYEEGEAIEEERVIESFQYMTKTNVICQVATAVQERLPSMRLPDLAHLAITTSHPALKDFHLQDALVKAANRISRFELCEFPSACLTIALSLVRGGETRHEGIAKKLFQAAIVKSCKLKISERAQILDYAQKLNIDPLLDSLLNEKLTILKNKTLLTIVSNSAKAKKYDVRVETAIRILIERRLPLNEMAILVKAIATFAAIQGEPTPFAPWCKELIQSNVPLICAFDVKDLTRFLASAIIFEVYPAVIDKLADALRARKFDIDPPRVSKEELEVSNLASKLGFERNHRLHEVLNPDCYRPGEKPIAIEYDGFWHYIPDTNRRNGETILRNALYRKLGYSLFVISYLDWPERKEKQMRFLEKGIKTIMSNEGPIYIGH